MAIFMTKGKSNKNEKNAELEKYRALVLATIDYYLENTLMKFKTEDNDSDEHYKSLKIQTEGHFQKGRLLGLNNGFGI